MLKNFLAYFVLWIVFQLLDEIHCQMKPFKPRERYIHTATHIDDKFYILGGVAPGVGATSRKEFFYLDVSVPFNTKDLLWQNISDINNVPSHVFATTVKGGADNNTLFLYGGLSSNFTMELVYTFNSQNNSWNTPVIAGNNTIKKDYLTGVINYSGKMHLWSGDVQNGDFVNDMLILDTINLIWTKGSSFNAPSARMGYGATLLPDQNIIYMGGINAIVDNPLPLNEVYMYDTINDTWNTMTTSGDIPSNRFGFSVNLGLDGQRVIIYGGRNITVIDYIMAEALYVLDLTNFKWYVPKISGNIPKSRFYHQANIIKNHMVISFGCCYNKSDNNILLLDIRNNEEYTWMNEFDPSLPSSIQPDTSAFSLSTQAIIGVITAGSLTGIILLAGFIYLYKKNKDKKGEQKDNFIGKQSPESIINL